MFEIKEPCNSECFLSLFFFSLKLGAKKLRPKVEQLIVNVLAPKSLFAGH